MSRKLGPLGVVADRLKTSLDISSQDAFELVRHSVPMFSMEQADLLDRQGYIAWRSGQTSAPAALLSSQCLIFNPAGSNTDVLITRVRIASPVATELELSWTATPLLANTGSNAFGHRDTRVSTVLGALGVGLNCTYESDNTNATAGRLAIDLIRCAANASIEVPGELVIAPGIGLLLLSGANVGCSLAADGEDWPRRVR